MNVALVYDRVNKFGGAERVLQALHDLWPEAPLFTSVYDKKGASWAKEFDVRSSFLQRVPFAKRHHELFAWATPIAFESFSFDDYDVVLSVTSAEAKTIITKPETLHICYCLTPTRYLWSGVEAYTEAPGFGGASGIVKTFYKALLPTLRRWDLIGAARPDTYVGISETVSKRVEQYYGRKAQVIYPPVDGEKFSSQESVASSQADYFLTVSRLVGYKRVDIVVDACTELGLPLVVIGDGSERKNLMKRAGKTVKFVSSRLTDSELAAYYQKSRAFLFAGLEDFGIVAAEAQAAGKPVIGYNGGGVAEIVTPGTTGLLFDKQTKDSMMEALVRFASWSYSPDACRKRADRFAVNRFKKEIQVFVEREWNLYQKHL